MAQWWDEWQLRILVLASLCSQYFLVLFAGVRKYYIPPWLRASFRLAHIGSDALALFVLAMLFNRQKGGPRCSYARGSRDLELSWAPIVLMHLGGQVVITSYKIEDNEQWSRHILTSLSKVTIALYVFYKSWSSDDKKLLATTILLFILVIIRCFQKVWNLKSSSFNALRKANPSKVNRIQGTNVLEEEEQLDKFISDARETVKEDGASRPVNWRELFSFAPDKAPIVPEQLFSDLPCSYSDRLETLIIFWSLEIESAYKAIEAVLSAMTSYLYTKDDATDRHDLDYFIVRARLTCRACSHLVSYGNATFITAILLVHTSTHRQAHRGEDTWVTLVLLYGSLVLELVYVFVQSAFMGRFSGRILQRSLIGLLTHNRRFSRLRRIAGWLRCKDLFDDYFWQTESYSCEAITILVRWYVKTWWTSVSNRQDYRRLNDTRGDDTLTRNGLKGLAWSIQRPFDESIILWHLATELCFHCGCISPDYRSSRNISDGPPGDARIQCKLMSDYMMHLLFDNPEMLMPGSRKSLFTMACDELEEILKSDKTPRDEMGFTKELIEKCKDGSIPDDSFVRDAWLLVQSLQGDFNEETKMWEVIQGVWVEMLCFSACRCRGYLHAEALGTGAEYLSYAWVLLAFSGMQTFPEKLQRREVFGMETIPKKLLTIGQQMLMRQNMMYNDEPYNIARRIRRTRSI